MSQSTFLRIRVIAGRSFLNSTSTLQKFHQTLVLLSQFSVDNELHIYNNVMYSFRNFPIYVRVIHYRFSQTTISALVAFYVEYLHFLHVSL